MGRQKSVHWAKLPEGITRQCTKCGKSYLATPDYFHKRNRNGIGLDAVCKLCKNTHLRRFQRKALKFGKRLSHEHRITYDEYLVMLKVHDNKCAICGGEPSQNGSREHFAIDHNHITGKIRGLLCTRCNPMLGFAQDSIEILHAAVKYLQKYGNES